ncbi:MAG: bifunctional heptose 7-phosphate kinase/heptose 1-phosphate adenyltransferase [Burkholderiaceae bacterium]
MKVLPKFDGAKILVIGDVMLDRYWFGDVKRISPEAPVPVLRVSKVEERPGGAANVARNIAALGAQVTLLSVVGADEAGVALENLLNEHDNLTAQLHRDDSISTIIKLRAVARHQQLLRIDFETAPSHEVLHAVMTDFRTRLPQADVVILSDYGKGGLVHIVPSSGPDRARPRIRARASG